MSAMITLALTARPEHSLVADCVAPDRLAGLTSMEIAALPVVHGGRVATLGDFFRVRGERASDVRIEGDLARVEALGARMAGGALTIEGSVGRDLGIGLAGGRIDVRGAAGDNAGGAGPGAAHGMTGGEIVIRGTVGAEAGARMRRGLVVVTGEAGEGTGKGMIAGTVVLCRGAGPGTGRFLKRGSIVTFGALERPATFRYACTYRPLYVALLLRYLRNRYSLDVAERHVTGRYERYSGDLAEIGRGEILQWVGE